MSIIQCPECKNDISDQAIACPNCGYPLSTNETCDSTNKQNQLLLAHRNVNKKIIVVFLIFIVLAATVFTSFYFINKQKERVSTEHYKQNLSLIIEEMLSCAIEAESIIFLTSNTWGNFMATQKNVETDKYTRKNNGQGSFYNDINIVLNSLMEDEDTTSKIKKINDSKTFITKLMNTMNNPPKSYKTVYPDLVSHYAALCSLADFSVQIQSGTHEMYLKSMNEKIEKFVETRRKVVAQIDQ